MLVELAIKGFLLAVLSRDFTSKGTWNTFNKCSNTLFSAFICIYFYALRSAGTVLFSVARPDWHLLLPPARASMWDFRHASSHLTFFKPCICFCVWGGWVCSVYWHMHRVSSFSDRGSTNQTQVVSLGSKFLYPLSCLMVHTWLVCFLSLFEIKSSYLPRPHSNLWVPWSSCFHLPSSWVCGHPPSHLATPFIFYSLF